MYLEKQKQNSLKDGRWTFLLLFKRHFSTRIGRRQMEPKHFTFSLFFLPLRSRADNLSDKLITWRRDALYHRFSFITPRLPLCLPANEKKKKKTSSAHTHSAYSRISRWRLMGKEWRGTPAAPLGWQVMFPNDNLNVSVSDSSQLRSGGF